MELVSKIKGVLNEAYDMLKRLLVLVVLAVIVLVFLGILLFSLDSRYCIGLFKYNLTETSFVELYENHNYHAAIFLAEADPSLIEGENNTPNKDMLRDCYLHVGEYTKAEKLGRELLSFVPDLSEVKENEKEFVKLVIDNTHAVAARDLFRLYEIMGDRAKQLEMYEVLKQYGDDACFGKLARFLDDEEAQETNDLIEKGLRWDDYHKYDLICGLYLENPDAAIDSLEKHISHILPDKKKRTSLKLTYLNRYISWRLERNEIFKAQVGLMLGLDQLKLINDDDLEPLGEFAEYCYRLHDYKNAKRYIRKYMRFMEDRYSDDDMEYLLAQVRYISYQDISLAESIERVAYCCRGLREQISKNFAGMTTTQQEYFSEKLRYPFSYAMQLLREHPNDNELTELCFENEVFNRGLLMRSDVLLRKALTDSKDTSLVKDYEKYISMKRELVARDGITGPGNFAKKMYLKKQIADSEKRLADGCSEFVRDNYAQFSIPGIMSSLSHDESLVMYVELPEKDGKSMGAFVLNRQDGLTFVKLCDAQGIAEMEQRDALKLCEDQEVMENLFAPIEMVLPNSVRLLYSPVGIMNRIPLAALSTDDEHTLGDRYKFSLVANPIDISNKKVSDALAFEEMKVVLWGGVEYGESQDTSVTVHTRAIMRGSKLMYLPGSRAEVDSIAKLLSERVSSLKQYTGYAATEHSFKQQATAANIVHVSTHGFFEDVNMKLHNSAMHNSGLFFANANRAWRDEYMPNEYESGYEDGILRADEIESMNLSECELVVLSACETGWGEIRGNEGVYGLQRALKLAGARRILMSLWSVPDAATEELMKRFYQNLLEKKNVDEAFADAQDSMKKMYGIRDWGGFVLMR